MAASNRRILMAVLAAGIVAVAALNGSAGQAQTPPAFRPNVVMIMTDDQTVESMRVMPNVKTLLADRGVTFDNSFVSYSLCCPSRATYLTGQYAHNHGVIDNLVCLREHFDDLHHLAVSVQTRLDIQKGRMGCGESRHVCALSKKAIGFRWPAYLPQCAADFRLLRYGFMFDLS